jgi:hypothetical protein
MIYQILAKMFLICSDFFDHRLGQSCSTSADEGGELLCDLAMAFRCHVNAVRLPQPAAICLRSCWWARREAAPLPLRSDIDGKSNFRKNIGGAIEDSHICFDRCSHPERKPCLRLQCAGLWKNFQRQLHLQEQLRSIRQSRPARKGETGAVQIRLPAKIRRLQQRIPAMIFCTFKTNGPPFGVALFASPHIADSILSPQ